MSSIEIIQNRSFINSWIIPNVIKNINNINTSSSEMQQTESNFLISESNSFINILKNNNIINTLKSGKGFGVSTNKNNGEVSIIASISDVSHFEIGEYDYEIKIYDVNNNIIFENNGIIEVKENISGETLNIRTPFDLFEPFNELNQ